MRCWAEINLLNLIKNVKEIEKITSKEKILAIIKANAYGHGILEVYEQLVEYGIKWFGVATFEEALTLREKNEETEILILGPIEKENMAKASMQNICFPIISIDEINFLIKHNIEARIHVKIDTGMGRVGFDEYEVENAVRKIEQESKLRLEGLFSHLSSSESSESYSKQQIDLFRKIAQKYNYIQYKHLLNSFGSLHYYDSYYDFIRPGIVLYGGTSYEETKPFKFTPVMSLKSKISFIKKIKKPTYISYGNKYLAQPGEIIATVSIGYADGVRRELTNKGQVFYRGENCKIVGTVCMDQLMISIPLHIEPEIGDVVEIFGEHITCVDVAQICKTISYEIICGVSQRVPRIYKK